MSTTEEGVKYNFVGLSKDTGLSIFEIKSILGIQPSFGDLKSAIKGSILYRFESKLRHEFDSACRSILEEMTTLENARGGFNRLLDTRYSDDAKKVLAGLAKQKVEEVSSTSEMFTILDASSRDNEIHEAVAIKALGMISFAPEFLKFYKELRNRFGIGSESARDLYGERARKFAKEEIQAFDGRPEKIQLIFELLDVTAPRGVYDNLQDDFFDLLVGVVLQEEDLNKLRAIDKAVGYRNSSVFSTVLKRKIFKAWERAWKEAETFEEVFQLVFKDSPSGVEIAEQREAITKVWSLLTDLNQFRLVVDKIISKTDRFFYNEDSINAWLRLTLLLPEEERYEKLIQGLGGSLDWICYESQYRDEAIGYIVSRSESLDTLINLNNAIQTSSHRSGTKCDADIYSNLLRRIDELMVRFISDSNDIVWLVGVSTNGNSSQIIRRTAKDKARDLALEQIPNCDDLKTLFVFSKQFAGDSEVREVVERRILFIARESIDSEFPDKSRLVELVGYLPRGSGVWSEALAKLANFYKI